jgi:hypothetical protein
MLQGNAVIRSWASDFIFKLRKEKYVETHCAERPRWPAGRREIDDQKNSQ